MSETHAQSVRVEVSDVGLAKGGHGGEIQKFIIFMTYLLIKSRETKGEGH